MALPRLGSQGLALLAALAATAAPARAFEFQPIVAQLAPAGPGSARSFLLTNTHPKMIAVELQVFRRTHDPDGTERRAPEPEDFIIVPAQLVLPPNSSQAVNVQWVGRPDVEREASYRLVATQLPIEFQAEGAAGAAKVELALSYVYEAALYVTPPKAAPDLALTRAEPREASGRRELALTFESRGATRAIIEAAELRLTPVGGGPVGLSPEQLQPLLGRNFIAGSTQTVTVPWPGGVPFGPVTADFRPKYLLVR